MKARLFLLSFAAVILALSGCTDKKVLPVNSNGIWVWSKYMNDVDLDELHNKGIGNVILHEASFGKYGEEATIAFVKAAEAKDILVHIWFQCFYTGGSWVNPVDDENNCYKQEYFDSVIKRAEHYLDLGVRAIHLDYIRFGGTAYKHNPSEEITAVGAVTEFCRQLNVALKAKNPDVLLSAAIMPEPESEYYYGQDPAQMGKYLDVLMPMIYRHVPVYKKEGEKWAVDVANYFTEKGKPAKVWAGTTTYTGDDDTITPMTADEIMADCRDFKDNTAVEGVVLFRYGLGELPDLSSLFTE